MKKIQFSKYNPNRSGFKLNPNSFLIKPTMEALQAAVIKISDGFIPMKDLENIEILETPKLNYAVFMNSVRVATISEIPIDYEEKTK